MKNTAQQISDQTIFPQREITGQKFEQIQDLKKILQKQECSKQLKKCFRITYDEGSKSIFCCKLFSFCKARIVLAYDSINRFEIAQVQNKHNHSIDENITELKQHHISSHIIKQFKPSWPRALIPNYPLILRINSICQGNPGPSKIGYLVLNEKKTIFLQNKRKLPQLTNNQAQFLSLIWGLLDCLAHGIKQIKVQSKSTLVIDCMKRNINISSPNLLNYIDIVKMIQARIVKTSVLSYQHLPKKLMEGRIIDFLTKQQ